MKIILASQNPVKLNATRNGFSQIFPDVELDIETVSVPSGVADQPMTDDETRRGARNRANGARSCRPEADYWIGLEGGLEPDGDRLSAFAWAAVASHEKLGESRTASFHLPKAVADLVRSGKELGVADDIVFGHSNSKQKGGAVGLLTEGVIDRAQLYEPAVSLALIPFLRPDLYGPDL